MNFLFDCFCYRCLKPGYHYQSFRQWRRLREIFGGGGGGGEIFNMYAFVVGLRYANLSNIMLGISNSLFDILL